MTNHKSGTDDLSSIDLDTLKGVSGGMKWEDFRPSTNIEDRRGMSPADSMSAPTAPSAPLPDLVRTPGDLSSQAGLDNMR